jgi:hypothetical protein
VAELTVKAMVVLWTSEPEVPVTVTVAVPRVAVEEAVNVRKEVTVPFAGGVTGLVANDAVTPLGRPLALSVVAELKPPELVTVIVLVPVPPVFTVREAGEALTVKLGVTGACTVTVSVLVATRLPEVPVMVTVTVPRVAVLLAVSVSTLVLVVLVGLKEAVTPLGNPDAARLTVPVNPLIAFTVIVLVPPAAPWVIVRLLGESERVKLGDEDPARALIMFCPLGLPHPVTRS